MNRVVVEGPYTLTLVAVSNVNGTTADFTSTLETMVDDIEDITLLKKITSSSSKNVII